MSVGHRKVQAENFRLLKLNTLLNNLQLSLK